MTCHNQPLALIGCAALLSLASSAAAQQEADTFATGEFTQVFACFYECKPGPTVQGTDTWQEITTHVVTNLNAGFPPPPAGADDTRVVNLLYLDGNQNIIGASRGASGLTLSPEDVDEINVCRTLEADPRIQVPQIGIVEYYVAGGDPGAGVYAWIKNLLGKFFVTVDEPFSGRVKGIAKTECRLVPPEVAAPMELAQKFAAQGPGFQDVPIILVEDTDDF